MKYLKKLTLKNGDVCTVQSAEESDAAAVLENFNLTHAQTDFLMTYPDENTITEEEEREFLRAKEESKDECELIAIVRGAVAGTAGIEAIRRSCKLHHRAEFGVSVDRNYWGIGIGRALTEACIECARRAGYTQLELSVVADNTAAVSLYRSVGFCEYGRNPRGFLTRESGYQEIIHMRLELDG